MVEDGLEIFDGLGGGEVGFGGDEEEFGRQRRIGSRFNSWGSHHFWAS